MNNITVAADAGFCPGVRRAVELLEQELARGGEIYCLGELIHNRPFNERLRAQGVKIIDSDSIDLVPEGAMVFIRAHGETAQIYEKLAKSGRRVIDATCAYVRHIHRIVAENSASGATCVILGDKDHPEVRGITSFASAGVEVYGSAKEALCAVENRFTGADGLFFVAQTTFSVAEWKFFANNLRKLYTNALIFDTICTVTETRQENARRLAAAADLVCVVGSPHSSNTAKLLAVCRSQCANVFAVETAEELAAYRKQIIPAKNTVIIAGASSPGVIIQEVNKTMANIANEELSFEELLDQSFKTLTTGERVTGTILAVTPAEIKVDLGTKHTGILPYDEISADDNVDMSSFRVGDPIDVVCTKFSDVEGTVLLSKKRLDEAKNAEAVAQAAAEGGILQGTVKDVVKGGVIMNVSGIRVFVPATQCGREGTDLESLKGKKLPVKIIEYQEARKRAVGSIRSAAKIERKQRLDEFYSSIEVGQKIKGTVRSITNFGVFVNLGAADGMIHVSEIFWGIPRNPAEVFKIGDEVEVTVKEIDRDRERISLGYKTEETNPWRIFNDQFKVGDIANVTIVSLMPFGAFAEIIPGVDGLIHCSQIADRYVPNPGAVLKVGDKVDVKIIAIDDEKHRISLSIRALTAPTEFVPAEAAPEAEAEETPFAEEAPAEEAPAVDEAPAEEASDAPAEE